MGAKGQLADLYDKILGSTAPSGASDSAGDISEMIKYIVANVGGRVHVGPHDWARVPATDYWLVPNDANLFAALSATNGLGLPGFGWTTTSLLFTAGTAGDFLTSGDDDFPRIGTDASADELISPRIFGGYQAGRIYQEIMGALPTKLIAEFYAQFSVVTGIETTTYIGFATAANVDAAAAGCGGAIASALGAGAAVRLVSDNDIDNSINNTDTSWHLWRIEVSSATTEWFIDDVSQGTITTEADIWPLSFKMRSGTTNRIHLAWLHIWME